MGDESAQPSVSRRDPRLSLALSLAREGGRYAVGAAGRAAARWKRPGERVTDVDLAIQARMIREIGTWFPEDGVLAEEDGGAVGLEREFVWVLDPLDGTNNYALGIPCFAVSVGILRAGEPWAGVVHDPNTGFTAAALLGAGTIVADRPVSLADEPLGPASNVCVRVPVQPALRPMVAGWMSRYKLRGFGVVALHLAYAATGALAVVLDHRAALWDVAAGAALVIEAGGCITTPLGEPLFPVMPAAYHGGPLPFVAGNRLAHGAAIAECKRALARAKQGDA